MQSQEVLLEEISSQITRAGNELFAKWTEYALNKVDQSFKDKGMQVPPSEFQESFDYTAHINPDSSSRNTDYEDIEAYTRQRIQEKVHLTSETLIKKAQQEISSMKNLLVSRIQQVIEKRIFEVLSINATDSQTFSEADSLKTSLQSSLKKPFESEKFAQKRRPSTPLPRTDISKTLQSFLRNK